MKNLINIDKSVEALVDSIFDRIERARKLAQLDRYIKTMLGEDREQGEVEKVKERVLLMLDGDSWQDIPLKRLIDNVHLIDESIKSIMSFRTIN